MHGKSSRLARASLAQLFDAPEGHALTFGWICGYSADPAFLEDAIERATGLTSGHRAQQGQTRLALMLDRTHVQIPPTAVPGLLHLGWLESGDTREDKSHGLMHAKVALLAYRRRDGGSQEQPCGVLRLIVSTGNWTRQTLEESLDLAWTLDVNFDGTQPPDTQRQQACQDVCAAADFLVWLRGHYDSRLIQPDEAGAEGPGVLDGWVALARGLAERAGAGQPRFIDSRKQSLLSQIPARVRELPGDLVRRNYLGMGSGFYESGPPTVPQEIVQALQTDPPLLTHSAEVDLFVNPAACQGIASSAELLQEDKRLTYRIRRAAAPAPVFGDGSRHRSLHAKFLFSANHRENSTLCSHPWIYLGSGNLTRQGLTLSWDDRGNLEAGVVFKPDGPLLWEMAKGADPASVITHLLPMQWHDEIEDPAALAAGDPFEPMEGLYLAPPVAWLEWADDGGAPRLRIPQALQPVDPEIGLHLWHDGEAVAPDATGSCAWTSEPPRSVRCTWRVGGREHEAEVPVVDDHGRVAAVALGSLSLDEALWQLLAFPQWPDDDADEPEDHDAAMDDGTEAAASRRPASPADYPLRRMMGLVETIAEQQTGIAKLDWNAWCARLEQTLLRMQDDPSVRFFRTGATPMINLLSPLRAAPFRPTWAETADTPEGERYEAALDRIEQAWGLADALPIGAPHA
jgi:hypothetical protein